MTILDILRRETGALHRSLHRLDVFRELSQRKLSVERYRDLLQCLYGFYQPFDPALGRGAASLASGLHGIDYQARTPMLVADLEDLGVDRGRQKLLPCCTYLPTIECDNRILGALYVVEGSVLGGRFLCQQLDASFGSGPKVGRRYFRWCAEQDGHHWLRLCEAMESRKKGNIAPSDLIDAAKEVFSALLAWMTERNMAASEVGIVIAPGERHAPL